MSPRKPVGYAAHVLAQPDPGRYVRLIEDGGGDSLRDDLSWAEVQPTRGVFDWTGPDKIVSEAALHHLHVLPIVDTTPTWASGASMSDPHWETAPPLHPSDYGKFAAEVAARYGVGGSFWRHNPQLPQYLPAGIELWNEENLGSLEPVQYMAMLKSAYGRIKSVDRSMTVIVGGLGPAGGYNDVLCTREPGSKGHSGRVWNPVNYLKALYVDGLHNHFDAIGWHPYFYYPHATAQGMLRYNYCSAWSQMAATRVSARSLMIDRGDGDKPIWATEVGAPTCIVHATFRNCVFAEQQAKLAASEASIWKHLPWAGGYYWYDIRDDNLGYQNRESHFGTVRLNDTPKLAYIKLRQAWR